MTLVQQAIDTYKAIHGEEPPFELYKGASDHPFEGISSALMQEMVNQSEVRSAERQFKINLNKKYKGEGFKIGDFVTAKRANNYSRSIKKGRIFFLKPPYYGVVDLDSIGKTFLEVRLCDDLLKKRSPSPGERDEWDKVLAGSSKKIGGDIEITDWGEVRENPMEHPAKYELLEGRYKYVWVEKVLDGNILKVRASQNPTKSNWCGERYIFASKIRTRK